MARHFLPEKALWFAQRFRLGEFSSKSGNNKTQRFATQKRPSLRLAQRFWAAVGRRIIFLAQEMGGPSAIFVF